MRKKVLFVIDSLAGGGAEKVLTVLTKYFNYEVYEVTVCPIVDEGVYREDVKRQVTHYKPIISYKGSSLSRLWNQIKYKLVYFYLPLDWVYKWFLPQGNDIEIAFCEGYVTKLLAHAHSKTKKVAWVHTDLNDNPWPIELGVFNDSAEEGDAYKQYDKIVCVSETVNHSLRKLYDLGDKITTVYNPIDIEQICNHAGEKQDNIETVIRLISVGRLVKQKGYDRLLRVVKRLHKEGYPVNLLILGDGDERPALEAYIGNNDMDSYVSLPGFSTNPYRQIKESDIFVCSSRAEGFSLVIAEAMALGVPVVSTYCSGPNELLEEGKCGMLVDNSEDGLYLGLKEALANMEQMNKYIPSAQDRLQDFVPQNIIKKIELLIS